MSLQLTINNVIINDADIASIPVATEKIDFDSKVLPDTYILKLDNTARTNYDDRYPASFFYASDFYGWTFDLYDNDNQNYVFRGKVKNITIDENRNEIEIEATNYIEGLSKKNTVYSNSTNKTIAAIIYDLLNLPACGDIDASLIRYDGFQNAINIQAANSAYIDIDYVEKDSKTIINVINELLRISQCHLYVTNNVISLYQWQQWAGTAGERIINSDIIPKTYRHYFNQDNIKNSFSVAYDNSGTVAYSTGSDATSILSFGVRPFNIPNDKITSTTSTDYKILFRNSTGAAWAGNLALTRYKYIQKYFEVDISYQRNYLQLASQIDLSWYPFYGEPAMICEREVDSDNKKIKVKGLFLNTPHQYFAKDYTPPDPVEIVSAYPVSNEGIAIKFTKCLDVDWLGYKIYFTSSPGEWRQEICHLGQSPIDNKTTAVTFDGYIVAQLHQLEAGATYYFKVTAYDTSNNESLDSNIESCPTYSGVLGENIYRLNGNIFYSTLTLDDSNPLGGTVPADIDTYADSPIYGTTVYEPAAVYESPALFNNSGWTSITWHAAGDYNDIQFQYKTSDDNITYTSWTARADAVLTSKINFSGEKYFKIRFLFNSSAWTDTDYIYIDDIE